MALPAPATERVALLIANSEYQEPTQRVADEIYLPRLDSPAADLMLMEKTLSAAGFTCSSRSNRTTAQMRTDVQQFASSNIGASVALFYYSGHGLAQDGVNYLAGIDARIDVSEKLTDLERARSSGALSPDMLNTALADIKRRKAQEQLMPLEDVLAALSGISNLRGDRKIVLLDACRDPFASSQREHRLLATKGASLLGKGGGGLAKPTERPGMFIGFSAAAGQAAIAFPNKLGRPEPSLFTRAFCAEALKPGVQLRDVFDAAAVTVYDESQKLVEGVRRDQRLSGVPADDLVSLDPQTPAAYSVVFPPGFTFRPEQAPSTPTASETSRMARLTTPFPATPTALGNAIPAGKLSTPVPATSAIVARPTRTVNAVKEVAILKTSAGVIVIDFWPDVAPKTVANFLKLAKSGFYDGTAFHRIIDGFMIQGGDPLTKDSSKKAAWGTGGASERIKAEFNARHHELGVISMARGADVDSASSQFFICLGPAPQLDGKYTVFGKLISGDDVLRRLGKTPVHANSSGENSQPTGRIALESVRIVPADSLR